MSISCQFCRQKIGKDDINRAFVFSFGDVVDGKFIERETQYYHADCLNNSKYYSVKKEDCVKT